MPPPPSVRSSHFAAKTRRSLVPGSSNFAAKARHLGPPDQQHQAGKGCFAMNDKYMREA